MCHGEYELPMTHSSFVCDTNYRLSSLKNYQPLSLRPKSYDEYFLGQFCGSDLSCVTQAMGLLLESVTLVKSATRARLHCSLSLAASVDFSPLWLT